MAQAQAQAPQKITPELIQTALRYHYTPPKTGDMVIEGEHLIGILKRLPSLSVEEHIETIHQQLQKHFPGSTFKPEDYSLIAFIDDCFSRILKSTDVDFKIEAFFRDLAPYVAVLALENNNNLVSGVNSKPILTLLDLLLRECIGWSEDLGIIGDQYMEKLEITVRGMINGRLTLENTIKRLSAFFKKQEPLFDRLEQRLCSNSLENLAGKKGHYYSTKLLNDKMSGNQFPLFIIFMLQGAWYEFLQTVFIHYREESHEWKQACKLTTALVESLKSGPANSQQKNIMKVLPGHIRTFCKRMAFDTTAVVQSLADVEGEYESISKSDPSEPCDFDLLESEDYTPQNDLKIDPKLHRKIASFTEGLWFYYDDKVEADEKVARMKLVLNWSDTGRMLFTNHNRRKTLEMSYTELAVHLKKGTMRLLSPKHRINEYIRLYLTKVVNEYQAQLRKQKKAKKPENRKVISMEYVKNRRQEQAIAKVEHKKHVVEKTARAEVLRHKSEHKIHAAESAVSSLKPNAWVNLPVMKEVLTPCKLAAYIAATDTYVFVNRAGMKVAEYTSSQLSHLFVTENSEILDTGAEFENVLSKVVMGLREERASSFDSNNSFGASEDNDDDDALSERVTLLS